MAKPPTYIAYSVRNYEKEGKEDANWSEIGVGFLHKDGMGIDVVLDALPVNGRVTLRTNRPKAAVKAALKGSDSKS